MVDIGQVITPQEIAIDLKEQIRIIRTRLFVLELLGRVSDYLNFSTKSSSFSYSGIRYFFSSSDISVSFILFI